MPGIEPMPQGRDLSPIDTVEEVNVTFDFAKRLASGATISTIAAVICTVYQGADSSPSSRLIGSAVIISSPSSGAADAAVLQKVGTMLAGVVYRLDATIETSDGQTLNLWGHAPCQAPN